MNRAWNVLLLLVVLFRSTSGTSYQVQVKTENLPAEALLCVVQNEEAIVGKYGKAIAPGREIDRDGRQLRATSDIHRKLGWCPNFCYDPRTGQQVQYCRAISCLVTGRRLAEDRLAEDKEVDALSSRLQNALEGAFAFCCDGLKGCTINIKLGNMA